MPISSNAAARGFAVRGLLLALALHALACGDDEDVSEGIRPPPGAQVAKSELVRERTPAVSDSELDRLGQGNRAFAFALYDRLRREPGNLFLSPLSVSLALAMTYAGAEGETERQMQATLHFELPEPALHGAFNAVDLALATRGEMAKGADGQPFRLHVVNQTWGQRDYAFQNGFLDTLARNYGAGMFLLDFAAAPEPSRVTINDWVAEQTAQRIEDLIPQGLITSLTRLVLTNAVYFNAAWARPFSVDNTAPGTFHAAGGDVQVPMMRQTASLRYHAGEGYQAVELPYDEDALRFVAILPDEGRFDAVEAALDDDLLEELRSKLQERSTTVTLPRFEYAKDFRLDDALKALGMTDAFDGGAADFSGIDGSRDLYISAVVHKAFVAVDEAGTEAAAATAVIVGRTSAPQPAMITLDRPFLFLILDEPTGQVLFLGRVLDPS